MNATVRDKALSAAEWVKLFNQANVETDKLAVAKSDRAKSTIVGNFLARLIDREVPISINGRTGIARLCAEDGRARQKLYYFLVTLDEDSDAGATNDTQRRDNANQEGPATGTATAANASQGRPSSRQRATQKTTKQASPKWQNGTETTSAAGSTPTPKTTSPEPQETKTNSGNDEQW